MARFSSTVPVGSAISAGVNQKSGAPVRETTCNDPGHFPHYPLSQPLSVIPDGSFRGWRNHSVSDEQSFLLIFGTLNVTFSPIVHQLYVCFPTSRIFILHPCNITLPFTSIVLSSYYNINCPIINYCTKIRQETRQQINRLIILRRVHPYQWSWYKAPCCLLNQMETWTTTRWELEHKSVQGEIEPLRLKSHQALNFKMKCNLLSCFLPNFGTVIDNWKIYILIGW